MTSMMKIFRSQKALKKRIKKSNHLKHLKVKKNLLLPNMKT